jgi:undecaprenyl-phosphate 4-deoxy-4-formamido-L-arabinose transferase
LQHPPEEIPKLLKALDRDVDVVYATPEGRVRGWTRNAVSNITKAAMATVLGTAHARSIGAFRIFRGSLRRVFERYDSPYVSVDVLLSWATTRITSVPVTYAPRSSGKSGYRLSRLVTFGVNMITGFSIWPLRLASIIGIGSAAFGVAVLLFVLARYLTAGVVVPGFAFLACMIAIFAGAQLLSLGIIGEYLARMYFRTMNKPSYVVESTINLSAAERVL